MDREPTAYSRPLVVFGLGAVLVADLAVGIPSAAFVGAGATVLFAAGAVHLAAGERRAAAGWGMFALALGFFRFIEGGSDALVLLAVGSLVVAGLALQFSERVEDRL
ncbi:hypothetical protein BRC85_05820 [Halobacteriales archaeon QS_1_69_70]|nr:MAG: hypothetical protein BRC85_05820 [Halobacteriales archaeon QS_1_69_70]